MKNDMKEYILNCIGLTKVPKFFHYFKLYSLIFISGLLISTIIGLEDINIADKAIFLVVNYTSLKFANFDMLSILVNNFLVSILTMSYFYCNGAKFKKYFGIIYFLNMGAITGFAVSIVALKYNLIIALSMIVPHGIIEVPTIIYAASSGWALSELNKNDNKKIHKEFIFITVITLVLLTISSYVEVYITPLVYDRLLGYYY